MGGAAGPIDEERRRRFEQRWREKDDVPVAEFLPEPSDPRYEATLLELLLIDLEMRAKRGTAPPVEEYARRFGLDDAARARLEREREELARRHGPAERRVGRYALRELVGQGASAHVWRAWDPDLSREVALKRLRPGLAATPEAVARFQREARSAARLRHPAIVTVHEVGKDGEDAYLVSDLIPGPTLAVALRERAYAPDEAARLAAQLADALDYAHQCGVVHRDVKPGNILLDGAGRPLLADFGLARIAEAEATLTRHGDLLGTPTYMSPEQARGETESVDARSDIYSLGVVLYELLCGRVPFEETSLAALSYAVVHGDPPRPRRIRPSIPLDLESVCLKAMAREPPRRYATAGAFAEDLRRYLARESVHARPRRAVTQAALWVRRNPALAAAVGAIVVVSAVGFLRVVEERARFRDQREQAQASLYRACLRETEAQLLAPGGAGRDAAWASLREATRLDVRGRDSHELRTLALRCLTAEGPYFRRLASWEGAEPRAAMALAPGGDLVAEAGPGGTLLRDAATGGTLASDPAPATAVAFAPDAARVATAHAGAVVVRDAATLAEIAALPAGESYLALAFAPGGRFLAAAGGDVTVFDLGAPGAPPRTLPHAARALAFSPDGARLAIGADDGILRIAELATGDLAEIHDFQNPVRLVAFGEEGDVVAASRELYTICRVDRESGEMRMAPSRHEAPIHTAFPGPRGLILTASVDGTIGAWDISDRVAAARADKGGMRAATGMGRFVVTVDAGGRRSLWRIEWTPGRMTWQSEHAVVFVPGSPVIFSGQQALRIDDGMLAPAPFHPGLKVVWGVAADPVRGRLASVTHAGGVILWNGRTYERERALREKGDISWTAAFSPDGSVLAAGSGPEVLLFEPDTGRERARLLGHRDERLVVALAFHPSRPLLASAALDRAVVLWDWKEAREERRLLDGVLVHGLAFGPKGRLVAACSDGAIRVWDAGLSAPERIDVGEDPVWAVAFGPGGLFATGSQAGEVRVWDAASWRVLAVLGGVPRVRGLAFDDTGRYLASSAWGAPAAVWDLAWLRERLRELDLDW